MISIQFGSSSLVVILYEKENFSIRESLLLLRRRWHVKEEPWESAHLSEIRQQE